MSNSETTVAFVCVQNAGRSQMAAAFAERKRDRRNLTDEIRILTGGTQPADHVHPEVVTVMDEIGIDLSENTPRDITVGELQASGYVITMGCSAQDVCPATWSGDNRDWRLDDPDGKSMEEVREIRDEIEDRVSEFFDEVESYQ
jgi:arsenate reductase (thioredoxin)